MSSSNSPEANALWRRDAATQWRREMAQRLTYEEYHPDAGFRPGPGSCQHDLFRRVEMLEFMLDLALKEISDLRARLG